MGIIGAICTLPLSQDIKRNAYDMLVDSGQPEHHQIAGPPLTRKG
jgi:hypothetical protein